MIAGTIFAAALNLVSCNPKELVDPLSLSPEYVVIDGDTIKTRNDIGKVKNKKSYGVFEDRYTVTGDTFMVFKNFNLPKPSKTANLVNIKNSIDPDLKGKPLRMVAIGGTFTAGMRDGGLFNEGMITSYPNIIANQMGIKYDLPLFEAQDYNGFGRKISTNFNPTGGPIPKLKKVENNTGVEKVFLDEYKKERVKIKKFKGVTDTYLDSYFLNDDLYNVLGDPLSPELMKDVKNGKKFDFFIMDSRIDQWSLYNPGLITNLTLKELGERDYKKFPEDGIEIPYFSAGGSASKSNNIDFIVRNILDKKLNKGILVNVPHKDYFGYYQNNYIDQVVKTLELYQVGGLFLKNAEFSNNFPTYSINEFKERQKTGAIYGSSSIDSLISPIVNLNSKKGLNKNNPIENIYFAPVKQFDNSSAIANNEALKIYAEYLKVPIFDLNNLYKSIYEGLYTTSDGVKVNGKWPQGNFFSSDGIHPSAFGHSVIANEMIKTINGFYKIDIPLVNTSEFLNK